MQASRAFPPLPPGKVKDWLPLLFGLVLVILVGAMSARLVLMNGRHNADLVRSLDLLAAGAELNLHVTEAGSAQRAFMVTGQDVFRQRYHDAIRHIGPDLQKLEALAGGNPDKARQVADLRRQTEARVRELEIVDELVLAGDIRQAAERIFLARLQVDAIRLKLDGLLLSERNALDARRDRALESGRWLLLMTIVGLALAILLVGTSVFKLRARARELEAANAEVRALNAGLERRVAERTADLAEANEEIQRFAYIVSHDLRSPLVNVMGFTAELEEAQQAMAALVERLEAEGPERVDRAERDAVKVDMPEAIGFIRAATTRMDRLIKAILQLSRQGRRPLSPEEVDLSALLTGLSAGLKAQLEQAGATISLGPLPVIESDRLALEQLFGNLLDNAVKYLRPGVPGRISVSAEEEPALVRIHVADNGRGIAREDMERVFDLFRRAGPQDRPGEGIGLAHVRALCRRLGGAITLDSTPGQGSRFTVSLPRRLSRHLDQQG